MVTMIMSIQPCNYGFYCFIWLASKQKISCSAQRFGPIWTKNFGHPFVSIWHLLGCGDHIYLWNRKQKIASFASTGWFTVCDIFISLWGALNFIWYWWSMTHFAAERWQNWLIIVILIINQKVVPNSPHKSARFQSNFPQTPVDMIYPQTFAIWNSS